MEKEKKLFNVCLVEGEYAAVKGELTTEDISNGWQHQFYCQDDYFWHSIVMRPNGNKDKEDRIAKEIEDISSYDREKLFELLNENHYMYTDNLEWDDDTKGYFEMIIRVHCVDYYEDEEGRECTYVHDYDQIVERFNYHTEWCEKFECWNVVIEK